MAKGQGGLKWPIIQPKWQRRLKMSNKAQMVKKCQTAPNEAQNGQNCLKRWPKKANNLGPLVVPDNFVRNFFGTLVKAESVVYRSFF